MNRFKLWLSRVMAGRYGTDQLNMVILCAGLALCLIGVFVRHPLANLLLTLGSYAFLALALFRTFSRNTYRRYEENRRFRVWLDRFRDKKHRYYICPRCRQTVRVPRHKGKIAITCPKCGERFVKKT